MSEPQPTIRLPAGTPEAADRERARRRRRRRVVVLVLAVVVAWTATVAASVLRARREVTDGLAAIRAAEARSSPDDLVDGGAARLLADSARQFDRAADRLGGWLLAPVRVLPVIGRQVRSAHALVRAAADVSAVGRSAVEDARDALGAPHDSGRARIALLRRMAGIAGRTRDELAAVRLGPRKALFAPLADRRDELSRRLSSVRSSAGDAEAVADGLAAMLAGPSRYLLLAANNAEMRAGSGMFLAVGELEARDGELSLADFRPAGSLSLDDRGEEPPPITDPDLAARWGWLAPNREWRNLATTPRFPVTASLAADMWAAAGGSPVDGVLALDPVALQAVLAATGPAEAAGRQVSADTLLDLLLHDQYQDIRTFADDPRAPHREMSGAIAAAAFGAITEGDFAVADLAERLGEAARGRHVLAWSRRPAEQKAWETAGVAGDLTAESLVLSLLNQGGNKLDRFLAVSASLDLRPSRGGTDGALQVTVRNTTPAGESPYIAGPHPRSGATSAGEYVGILSVNLPGFTVLPSIDGATSYAAGGADGPTRVVAVPIRVARGEERTFTVRFRVRAPHGRIVVEPSARVPAVTWTAPGHSWKDVEPRRVEW